MSDPAKTPAHLLDYAYAASDIAYRSEEGRDLKAPGLHENWRPVIYKPDSEKAQLLKEAGACELIAPNGQHYVAFAGSRATWQDWGENNIPNARGEITPKYEAAAKLGKLYEGENVVFTGHSLGGGLAKTAAEVASYHDSQALSVAFDPAPIASGRVFEQFGKTNPNRLHCQSISVVANTDTLNMVTSSHLVQDGNPVYIPKVLGHVGAVPIVGADVLAASQIPPGGLAQNETVIHAMGAGRPDYGTGHALSAMADPNHPETLTRGLVGNDGRFVDKGALDRFVDGRSATQDRDAVTNVLDNARTPDRGREVSHGR